MSAMDAENAAAARLRRQLGAVARFAQVAIRGETSLVDVLQAACQAACDGSGVGHAKALIHDRASGDLRIEAGVGWGAGVIGMHVPAHPRSIAGVVLRDGEPWILDDLPGDDRFDYTEPLRSHRIVSVANVPIRNDDSVLGVLEVDSDKPVSFSSDDLDFLHSLAGLVVPAIMRARIRQVARQAEQRIRESEERLGVALGAARMGTWLLHLPTNRHTLDENLQRLMGLAPGQAVRSYQDMLEAVHPEDREAFRAAFERTLADGIDLDVEFRVAHRSGEIRWLKDQGRLFRDDAGEPLFMAGACVDITERKEAELRLQRADRLKNEFLAMLAHELRNPMAPLMNAVALLERRSDAPPAFATALGIMRRQLIHLSRLVGDLLEVSRIEQGRIDLRIAPIRLALALDAAVETVQPMVDARRQRLSCHLPDEPVVLRADAVRLTQVVANLLHNASKFAREGGSIDLLVETHGDDVEIVVRDDGVGIPADALPHIFGLFEQGGVQPLDRSGGGLGIGLALVRRLVELHGGTVAAYSGGPGQGAEFVVRLPRGGRTG
jgi:PAS domain S-box-containing protein